MEKKLSEDIISYIENEFIKDRFNPSGFFNEIKTRFRAMDIALICNYILESSSDIKLLSYVIREIKSNKYRQNFDALVKFIQNSKDDDLKALAIKTICVFKDSSVAPILLECLQDKNSNYRVRFSAADAIGKIGGKNAFEALKYVVCDQEEKSAYVKESAVVALGNLGDNRAIDVFSSILSSKEFFLEKFTFLKERVIEAMSKLDVTKNSQAIEILKVSILDSSPQVRINSIEVLMNLECEQNYELIYDRLIGDSDFEVKKNALIALYNISDRKILDEVINGDFQISLKAVAQEIIQECEDNDE